LSDLLSLLLLLGFPELLSGAWYDNCTVNVTEVPDLPKQTRNNNNNNKNNNNNNHCIKTTARMPLSAVTILNSSRSSRPGRRGCEITLKQQTGL